MGVDARYACAVTERTRRNQAYVIGLGAISGAILLFGALLRPQPDAATSAAPPPSETDPLRLARLSQRRTLENMTSYFSSIADQAATSLEYLTDRRTSAVAWSPDLLISTGRARTTMPGPILPLVMTNPSDGSTRTSANRAASEPGSGDWVVAVWRSPSSHAFAPGTYLESIEVTCDRTQARELRSTVTLTTTMAGGGLFNVDGQLLAVVLRCDERVAAIDTDSVMTMLEYARSTEGRLLAAFGFRGSPLSLDEAAHFKLTGGVLVREVWEGSQAAFADLRPGDVIAVEDIDRLIAPVAAGQEMLLAKRGSREAKVALSRNSSDTGPSQEGAASTLGLVWERPNVGFPIESVVPGSAADKAGVRGGDVLLRINHVEPKDLAQVRRLLAGRGSKTAFIELARDGRRVGMLVF